MPTGRRSKVVAARFAATTHAKQASRPATMAAGRQAARSSQQGRSRQPAGPPQALSQQSRRSQVRSNSANQASPSANQQGSRQAATLSQQGRRRRPPGPQQGSTQHAPSKPAGQTPKQQAVSKVVAGASQQRIKQAGSNVVAAGRLRRPAGPQQRSSQRGRRSQVCRSPAHQARRPTTKAAVRQQGRRSVVAAVLSQQGCRSQVRSSPARQASKSVSPIPVLFLCPAASFVFCALRCLAQAAEAVCELLGEVWFSVSAVRHSCMLPCLIFLVRSLG